MTRTRRILVTLGVMVAATAGAAAPAIAADGVSAVQGEGHLPVISPQGEGHLPAPPSEGHLPVASPFGEGHLPAPPQG
ncbi:hypothetical protein [Streptomyces sp. G45]|uniref:hypothetical protein n=1 Tax=Streptomyces sp. G45 TaxID=3406627 RepID=UPI003C14655C